VVYLNFCRSVQIITDPDPGDPETVACEGKFSPDSQSLGYSFADLFGTRRFSFIHQFCYRFHTACSLVKKSLRCPCRENVRNRGCRNLRDFSSSLQAPRALHLHPNILQAKHNLERAKNPDFINTTSIELMVRAIFLKK
jgi:hypothetical protein